MRVRESRQASSVLEVALWWGETLLDVQRVDRRGTIFVSGHGAITLGPTLPGPLALGPLRIEPRWVTPGAPVPTLDGPDWVFLEILSFAFALQLALLAALWMRPADEDALSEGLFGHPEVLRAVIVRPHPRAPKFPSVAAAEGARPRGAEGSRGRPDARPERTAPPKPEPRSTDARRRTLDRARVLHAGLLGGFAGSAAAEILGAGGLDRGISRALGALHGGVAMEDRHGFEGLGSRGQGPGGGGRAVTLGGLGTRGVEPGAGGPGLLELGGPEKGPTRVDHGPTIVCGVLPKDVVGAIVRRHWHEIRYCYETGLSRNPGLYGKVAVAFTIGGTGAVSDATVSESTLGDEGVERCVTEHVRRWRFPEPRGGGQVFVTYPWIFRAAGE